MRGRNDRARNRGWSSLVNVPTLSVTNFSRAERKTRRRREECTYPLVNPARHVPRTRVRIANFLGAVTHCVVCAPLSFSTSPCVRVYVCACYSHDEVTADTSVRTHGSRARAYPVSGEPPKEATRVIAAESRELLNELGKEELHRRMMGGRGFGSCEKVIMTQPRGTTALRSCQESPGKIDPKQRGKIHPFFFFKLT